jgi:hypothetical protein
MYNDALRCVTHIGQVLMEAAYKQQRELIEKETAEQQERAGMLQRGGSWGSSPQCS